MADEEKSQQLAVLKLYVAGGIQDGKETLSLFNGCISPIPGLQLTHEEADTRLLHAV